MRSRYYCTAFLTVFCVLIALAGQPALADCEASPRSPTCGATPSAIFDTSGQLWVVYVDGDYVWLSRSQDFGLTYDTAVQVNTAPEAIYADGENRPVIALGDNQEVFVSWTRQNSELYSGDIRFARSLDGGAHFAPVVTVNDDGLLTSHRFVTMQRTPAGQLYLAWLDKRDQVGAAAAGKDYTGAALYYTVSTDNGSSFAANRKVADNSCECCRIAMTTAGAEQVKVLWRHVFEGGTVRDHAIATLAPEAASPAVRASNDHWAIDGCPHHGPALAAGTGGYHLSWFTNGDNNQGVMYGFHDDVTGETTRVHTIDPRPSGGHPTISVQGDTVTVVWKSFDGTQMNLQLVQSIDGGRHWQQPRVLATTAGNSDHPQALQLNQQTFIAWHTADEGYRLLRLAAANEERKP
jgi:hypothetical protein